MANSDVQLRKLELDITSANKQIDNLEKSWRQRWDDEKARLKDERDRDWSVLKDDRDRAWDLFARLVITLFALAGILWGGLMWWIRWQKNDLDKTVAEIPILEEKVRTFILKLSDSWPETESTLDDLKLRARLDNIRHQVIVEYIKEFNNAANTIAKLPAKAREKQVLAILDKFTSEVTNTLHLLSGSQRYVKLATNLYGDGEEMPILTRKLLPQLCEIYRALDGNLGATVEGLNKMIEPEAVRR